MNSSRTSNNFQTRRERKLPSSGNQEIMTVRVRLFGHYKDRVAADRLENGTLVVSLPADSTATIVTIADVLAREHIGLSDLLQKTRVAVGTEFAAFDAILKHGDEVAFLPPMSGG